MVLREELTPAQAAQDKAAGARYQALLDDILERSPYVYRYTTRFALNKVRENGWDIREAFMANVLVKNPNDVSLGHNSSPPGTSSATGTLMWSSRSPGAC